MEQYSNEKQDCHPYWIDLIRENCEIANPDKIMDFEVPVELENSICYIDVWIPATKTLIEQKSRGKSLDKPERQSDGSFLTPYQQAKRYNDARAVGQKANWIITSNFEEIWIYNMQFERPERHVIKIQVAEIQDWDLRFIIDSKRSEIFSEAQISEEAGKLIQKIRDLIFTKKLNDEEILALNKLCIRLVFCLYAEDTGIFRSRQFLDFLIATRTTKTIDEFKKDLAQLFVTLSTPKELREFMTSRLLDEFPYVDGELFKDDPTKSMSMLEFFKRLDGKFDLRAMIRALIDASANFNWAKISPTIFGSIFESIMNPETKHEDGIHYTYPENIHRVIDPLFLDDLKSEFERGTNLKKLHDKIASLKFFDPTCGSGNFLTETYISLRTLENRIIKKIKGKIRVSIDNFYGIDKNDFAVQIAKLALWISEHQMNGSKNFLPLKRNTHIVKGNSLSIDWKSVIPDADFIMGNPPYVGHQYRREDQNEDMNRVFGDFPKAGKLDYVCAWFKKASEYIRDSKVEVGFVSTNSICQGESVGILWKPFFEDGIRINFAHRSFKWFNKAPDRKFMAHVHCITVGFSRFDRAQKWIFEGKTRIAAERINGYLLDAMDIFIQNRGKMLTPGFPEMTKGSQPTDGGNLIIEAEDLDAFIEKEPRSKKFIRRYMMGKEFLHNIPRYCLWLVDSTPNERRSMKNIYARMNACREFRLTSKTPSVRDASKTPWLFTQIRQPTEGKFIAIPRISSERREYIPMGFLDYETICGDSILIVPEATMYLFGILMSSVHMAWMKPICGRLEIDFMYSPSIYNNFPFPNLTDKQKSRIESTAQKILDVRSKYPDSSLADLYDPQNMPSDLRKAHNENDRAVLDAYGFSKNISESEIVSRLFEMYQNLIRK